MKIMTQEVLTKKAKDEINSKTVELKKIVEELEKTEIPLK